MKLGLVLLLGTATALASPPDAAELVRRAAARYQSAEMWEYTGTTRISAGSNVIEIQIESAAASGGRERMFMRHPGTTLLYISDGTQAMACADRLQQCATASVAELNASGGHHAYGSPGAVRSRLRALLDPRYRRIAERAAGARILRTERLAVPGRTVETAVVQLGPPVRPDDARQGWTLWIARDDGLIWKDEFLQYDSGRTLRSATTWNQMSLGVPPSPRRFKIAPPPDPALVSTLDLPPPPPTVKPGQPPPALDLPSVDGGFVSLSALHGKVVLVDFWTTWCPPCRKELPVIEKLHREYAGRGFVALGVSDEKLEVVSRFRKENGLTFPTVIDDNGHVALAYQVYALPTSVLIDRSGAVVRLFVGDQTEATLRAAIIAAGL